MEVKWCSNISTTRKPKEETLKAQKGSKMYCVFGTCKSDSRSEDYRQQKYQFFRFPKPCIEYRNKLYKGGKRKHINNCPSCRKCEVWVKLCRRKDGFFESIDNVSKDTFICSEHFGGQNPMKDNNVNPMLHKKVHNYSSLIIKNFNS